MNQPSALTMDTDRRFALNGHLSRFPFPYELSLAPLVAFWQQSMADWHPLKGVMAAELQTALEKTLELLEPIEDIALLAEHQALVRLLMTAVFPTASWEEDYAAALVPFHLQTFYATPSFNRLMVADDGYVSGRINLDAHMCDRVRLLYAYACVLGQTYGIKLEFDYPLIFTATDPDTGLDRHFRMNFDGRFIQVERVGDLKPLTSDRRERLLANLDDLDVLMEIVPPEQFVIRGFTVLSSVDVTDQEVLSSLKRDLIEKESIISNTRFANLQDKLRVLFRKPELLFGLAAFHNHQVLMLNTASRIEYG
jgi:hypothetical protein